MRAEVWEILIFLCFKKKKLQYFCKVFIDSLDIVHHAVKR